MIDLKKYNYFTGDVSSVARGVSDLVKFLDLAGKNYILFSPPKSSNSDKIYDLCLYHYFENKILFDGIDEFIEKISNKSNLFRVDFIVVDLWSISKNNIFKYISVAEKTGLPLVVVSKEYYYKSTDDVNDFHIRSEYKDLHKSEIWMTDKISGTSTTLDSLKLSYIRNKKLEYLFGKT